MSDLTFSPNGNGQWTMTRSYPVGADETGSDHYRYVRTQPANVAKITGTYLDKNGREITTGTVIMNEIGIGYAWPTQALFGRLATCDR